MTFQHDPSFLAMVRADLDDDAPRLVYADFLQQKGARYGELLAASCALEAARPLPITTYGAFTELRTFRRIEDFDVERLTARVRELTRVNKVSWEEGFQRILPRELEWRRGFVDRLAIEAEHLTMRLFELAPCLTALDVHVSLGAELEPVVDSPVMTQVRRLKLGWGSSTAPRVEPAPPVLEPNALRALALPDVWLSVRALSELVARPAVSAITELSVFGARGHDGVIVRWRDIVGVLRSASSPFIRRLNVGHAQLGSEGFQALRTLPWFKELEVLNARDSGIEDRDVPMILEALPPPTRMRALDLSGNLLRDDAAKALASWPGTGATADAAAALTHLDLRGSIMSEDAKNELLARYGDRVAL